MSDKQVRAQDFWSNLAAQVAGLRDAAAKGDADADDSVTSYNLRVAAVSAVDQVIRSLPDLRKLHEFEVEYIFSVQGSVVVEAYDEEDAEEKLEDVIRDEERLDHSYADISVERIDKVEE
jgi:HEAT repeat protein